MLVGVTASPLNEILTLGLPFYFPQIKILNKRKILVDAIKDLKDALPALKFNKTRGINIKQNKIFF